MAISDRITSIEEHIKKSYQELEGIGIDTTGVNNNLENIPKLIDGYWETLPKVTGEGTSITLDNTKEGKMKINLKGNTSQVQYTGKNLFNYIDNLQTPYRGLTSTINSDGSITTTGIPQYNYTSIIMYDISSSLENGAKYTLSQRTLQANKLYLQINIVDLNGGATQYASLINATSVSFTANTTNKKYIMNLQTGPTANWGSSSLTITNYYQLEKGSSATSFEPYVGGIPSPNPNYPQDIHIVSGDNSINVVGKNLFKPTLQNNGTNIVLNNISSCSISNGEFSFTASGTDMYFGNVKNAGTEYSDERGIKIFRYDNDYISFNLSNTSLNRTYITAYDSNNISLGFTNINSNQGTYQFPSGCDYITIRFGKADAISGTTYKTTIMVAYGNTIPTYEPYQGNTYPINLGVENYLPNNATTQTINGITYTINEDKSIKINGTASGRADLWLYGSTTDTGNYVFIPKGTYTIDTSNLLDGTMFLQFREKTAGVVYQTKQNNGLLTLLSQQDCYFYGIMLAVESGKTINNLTFYPQIEKGTKLNSYTPYGTTPIELCKIGTYQDSIKKSTGKNLFDKDNANTLNCYVNGTSEIIVNLNNAKSLYIPIQSSKTYTISKILSARFVVGTCVSTPANGVACSVVRQNSTGTSITITSGASDKFLCVFYYLSGTDTLTEQQILNSIMINKGTTALPYEPYGTGWYVKKEIGKVVLDGTNNTFTGKSGTANVLLTTGTITNIKRPPNNNSLSTLYCNIGESIYTPNQLYSNNYIGTTIRVDGTIAIGFGLNNSQNITDATSGNTWLTTNNVSLYFPLDTPTYTEITDSTLISQLNALAKSYTSQTNISQESNDLASLLNATALEEM